MPNKTVNIPNINCEHCVRTIETELNALENVTSVKADETTKVVHISWDEPQSWEKIKSILSEINYPVSDL
jgi:copper chaperone CopZ